MSGRAYTSKTKTDTVKIDIDKYEDQNDNRTWVNTDRFWEFRQKHADIQEYANLSSLVQVEFELVLNLNKLIPEQVNSTAGQRLIGKQVAGPKLTGRYRREPEVRKSWFPVTSVAGGMNGVNFYIKHAITESVFRWEDSNYEIDSINLTRLYVSKQRQQVSVGFRNIKMYNSVFNYIGYGLKAQQNEIPNTCVPTYLLKLLNNPEETNPRKRLKKLTPWKILKELKMESITDGCSVQQLAEFCDEHKVSYYVLDYKYKLFESNNHKNHHSNLPRLVFMCANNHLYPIEDPEERETIFKTYANVGGRIKSTKKPLKDEEGKAEKYEPETIYECMEGMNFYARIDAVKTKEAKKKRIVSSQRGSVHSLFFSELRLGNIHNKNVKTNKENQVTGFEMDGILIDENQHYHGIAHTIETLNEETKSKRKSTDRPPYVYTGQSPHGLAYEYYTNNFDKNITSVCSPQVYDILTDSGCMNSPFLEFNNSTGTTAYDINKQYTNILMKGDKYGWSKFMPTDQAEIYDGKIEPGMYFIETENYRPLKGNGWYWDIVVEKALNYGLIDHDDIKYQVKSSNQLDSDHFKKFVLNVYEKFNEPKLAVNGFIGMLGRAAINKNKIHYEADWNVIANEIAHNTQLDFEIKGIYATEDAEAKHEYVNLLNVDDEQRLQLLNQMADDTEPVLYQISTKKSIPKFENTLAIHRKVYDIANMEMYELYTKVMKLNPDCEFVGIKTDCLVFNGITKHIPTSNEWGQPKLSEVPKIHECTIDREPRLRTETYEPTYQEWESIEPENCEEHIENGYLTIGMAGTGKTTKLNKAKDVIREKNEAFEAFVTACPTHKACKLVKGKTIHRLFNINPIDNSYEYGKVSELKSEGIQYIFVDEVSMVPERIWSVLAHIKTQFGFVFIGYGDFKQLKPVNEEHIDFFNSWIVKYVFGGKLCKLTTVHRFNDSQLLQDAYKCADGEKIEFDSYGHDEHDLALCYTNAAVDAVNEK